MASAAKSMLRGVVDLPAGVHADFDLAFLGVQRLYGIKMIKGYWSIFGIVSWKWYC